jgi:hypothetical protein
MIHDKRGKARKIYFQGEYGGSGHDHEKQELFLRHLVAFKNQDHNIRNGESYPVNKVKTSEAEIPV